MAKTNENLSYKEAMDELEKIVKAIEERKVDVDELIEKIKRAVFLVKYCKDKLQTTDSEVKKILDEIERDTGTNKGGN